MPIRATGCGLPVALSVIFSVAVRVPLTAGVNVTFRVTFAPGNTVSGAAGATEKSAALGPVTDKTEITKFAVPGLVIVSGRVPGLPTAWPLKVSVVVLRLNPGACAVPERATAVAAVWLLSKIFSVAERVPAPPETNGLNVMLICWLWPVCRTKGVTGGVTRANSCFRSLTRRCC